MQMQMSEHEAVLVRDLSKELYEKTVEALQRREMEVVVFIRFDLTDQGRAFLKQYGLTIRLVPEIYNQQGIWFEMWREALVLN